MQQYSMSKELRTKIYIDNNCKSAIFDLFLSIVKIVRVTYQNYFGIITENIASLAAA